MRTPEVKSMTLMPHRKLQTWKNNGTAASPLSFLDSHSSLLLSRKDRSWNAVTTWMTMVVIICFYKNILKFGECLHFFPLTCFSSIPVMIRCVCVRVHACAAHRADVFWEKGETETEETMPSLPGCIRNAAFSFLGIQHLLYSINLDMMFHFFFNFQFAVFC